MMGKPEIIDKLSRNYCLRNWRKEIEERQQLLDDTDNTEYGRQIEDLRSRIAILVGWYQQTLNLSADEVEAVILYFGRY